MMRVDILTTRDRDTAVVNDFWTSHGWTPVYHDNTGQPPGAGRNLILKEFYASGREWICIADDDIVFDTARGQAQQFLAQPSALLDKISSEITSFGVMNNIHHRVDITLNNPVVNHNWVFLRNYWIGCLMFHRNTGGQYWYHPTDVLEDMDWCIAQLLDHQRVAICMNLVMRNTGHTSTIFANQQQRRDRYAAAKQRIADSYPGITLTNTGKLMKTRLINSCWPASYNWHTVKGIGPSLVVPRD